MVARTIGLKRIELERLRERLGRLLAALQEAALDGVPAAPGVFAPPFDLSECGDAVHVLIELPGVRAEEIELTLTSTQLRLTGQKKRRAPRGALTHLCSERSYGRFSRIIMLRWPVRVGGATAELKDGLLTVRLPKLAERRGTEFKVEVQEQ
ncbi:MAG TPA: Hsp20/alpha crystallin family protein [Pyrinomonadaceae bacterium]|jgi:HSP20 family protein